jgi:hypothetical protein
MLHHTIHCFSVEKRLDSLEQFPTHERFMIPREFLTSLSDSHNPYIEGIVEYGRNAIHRYRAATSIAQSTLVHALHEFRQ